MIELDVIWKDGSSGSCPVPGTGTTFEFRGKSDFLHGNIEHLILLSQVHGARALINPSGGESGDAMFIKDSSGYPCVKVADCLPVGIITSTGSGMIHAGWRGLSEGIIPAFFKLLRDTENIIAAVLGPCICGSCYEVGLEVFNAVRKTVGKEEDIYGRSDKYLDLKKVAVLQLLNHNISGERIFSVPVCTFCGNRQLHSYRRNGQTAGRNLCWLDRKRLDDNI